MCSSLSTSPGLRDALRFQDIYEGKLPISIDSTDSVDHTSEFGLCRLDSLASEGGAKPDS